MKIYNYSTATIEVEGLVVDDLVIEVPDSWRGLVEIETAPLDWDEEANFQFVVVTDGYAGGYLIDAPTVTHPPIYGMVWLMVMAGGFALMVKILQKTKSH